MSAANDLNPNQRNQNSDIAQNNGNLQRPQNPSLNGALDQRSQFDISEQQPRRRGRGFASMDPQRVSEIASMGGKAAHAQGVAHEWSSEEARAAGRKGGQASRSSGPEGE